MASTRNKNSTGDYKLEQNYNHSFINYNTYVNYGIPTETFHPSNGILSGRVPSNVLSTNSCDIESMLLGIGSSNLENPLPAVNPNINNLKSLQIVHHNPVYLPQPLEIDKNQRFTR